MAKATAKPTTVSGFLDGLDPDRRAEVNKVRAVVKKNLPAGYKETAVPGFITYEVPLSRYPDTYNGHALWYVAIGSHKSYATLYMMVAYSNKDLQQRLKDGFKRAGKKLDMGKSCIHFKKADDLDLATIGDVVAAVPIEDYIAVAESARRR